MKLGSIAVIGCLAAVIVCGDSRAKPPPPRPHIVIRKAYPQTFPIPYGYGLRIEYYFDLKIQDLILLEGVRNYGRFFMGLKELLLYSRGRATATGANAGNADVFDVPVLEHELVFGHCFSGHRTEVVFGGLEHLLSPLRRWRGRYDTCQ